MSKIDTLVSMLLDSAQIKSLPEWQRYLFTEAADALISLEKDIAALQQLQELNRC